MSETALQPERLKDALPIQLAACPERDASGWFVEPLEGDPGQFDGDLCPSARRYVHPNGEPLDLDPALYALEQEFDNSFEDEPDDRSDVDFCEVDDLGDWEPLPPATDDEFDDPIELEPEGGPDESLCEVDDGSDCPSIRESVSETRHDFMTGKWLLKRIGSKAWGETEVVCYASFVAVACKQLDRIAMQEECFKGKLNCQGVPCVDGKLMMRGEDGSEDACYESDLYSLDYERFRADVARITDLAESFGGRFTEELAALRRAAFILANFRGGTNLADLSESLEICQNFLENSGSAISSPIVETLVRHVIFQRSSQRYTAAFNEMREAIVQQLDQFQESRVLDLLGGKTIAKDYFRSLWNERYSTKFLTVDDFTSDDYSDYSKRENSLAKQLKCVAEACQGQSFVIRHRRKQDDIDRGWQLVRRESWGILSEVTMQRGR